MVQSNKGVDKVRVVVDRIEKNQENKKIFVFEASGDDIEIHEDNIPTEKVDKIRSGDILEIELSDGKILSAEILTNETEKKREEMKSRLNGLFSKKKK